MRTTKPISTISYNTRAFLLDRLNALVKCRAVEFWAFVPHFAEDDEGGKKDHIHLYIEPAKILQTVDLENEFKEFDPSFPEKPLACMQFRNSKFDDWYMYGLHDKRYLAAKGKAKKYYYKAEDFVSSSDDNMLYKVKEIDLSSLTPYADMLEAIENGVTFPDYALSGRVPIASYSIYERVWWSLVNSKMKNTVYVHENGVAVPVNSETGERLV